MHETHSNGISNISNIHISSLTLYFKSFFFLQNLQKLTGSDQMGGITRSEV